MPLSLSLLLLLLEGTRSSWIYEGVDESQLRTAKIIGQRARIRYINQVAGIDEPKLRNDLYLEGLEKCNNIDRNWTNHVEQDVMRVATTDDAMWLRKAGMKNFTALFMTLPADYMLEISKAACEKHEKQLQCGAEFEGEVVTRKRIEQLSNIGNHLMMFKRECRNFSFVQNVYPCIGRSHWIQPCSELHTYASTRETVNGQIGTLYNNAIDTIKSLQGDSIEKKTVMNQAMQRIVLLEGSKCALFKTMRLCVLRQLLVECGAEAVRAFNTSISLGYMRTERRERLNLDFEVFKYPQHPNCNGL